MTGQDQRYTRTYTIRTSQKAATIMNFNLVDDTIGKQKPLNHITDSNLDNYSLQARRTP